VGFYDSDPFKGGFLIGSQTMYSIRAGETQTVQIDWKWTVNVGNYNIHVMADNSNLVIEKNEENNIKFKSVEISCKYDNSNRLHTPQSRKALIIVPYHHQGFVGYSEELKSKLKKIGFQVDYFKDEDIDIIRLDRLLDENYGVIHITSHGTETEIAIEYFYDENKRTERWDKLKQKYKEYGTNFEDMFIWRKEDEKGKRSYIGIKGDFIRARCSGLSQHPLVFFESCDMGNNEDMIDAFLCKGAGAYVGFDDEVMIDFFLGGLVYRTVEEVSRDFYSHLIDHGYTVKKAADDTEPGDHPDCRIPNTCRNVNLVSYGKDEYLILIRLFPQYIDSYHALVNIMMKSLSSTRISQAESLKEEACSLLEEAVGKGIDISEAQTLTEEADKVLADAKESFLSGNYIAANTLALRAISLYQETIQILEELLSS